MVDRFRQGRPATAAQLNELRSQTLANRLIDSGGGVEITGGPAGRAVGLRRNYIPKSIMCAITNEGPNGEDDYPDDERYWVRGLAIVNEQGDARQRLSLDYAEVLDENGDIVTADNDKVPLYGFWEVASNLSEWVGSSHSLSVNTPVEVFPIYDSRLDSNLHWAFFGSTSGALANRSGKITEVSRADGPPSAHLYKGVYMDVADEPEWKVYSRTAEGEIAAAEAQIQTLSGRDPNVVYLPLAIDDVVIVTMAYTNLADAAAGEEDLFVQQPIGLDTGEAPDFIVCTCA